jgi:hypothetical protein
MELEIAVSSISLMLRALDVLATVVVSATPASPMTAPLTSDNTTTTDRRRPFPHLQFLLDLSRDSFSPREKVARGAG